jgi:2-oxoglutarate ferredoxin oxidoreductase subunit delta
VAHPAPRPFERAPMVPVRGQVKGRVLIAKERCKGCELCIEFCPRDVLIRSTDFNTKGYHYPIVQNDECANCRLCLTICPEYAIFSVYQSADATPQQGGSACR